MMSSPPADHSITPYAPIFFDFGGEGGIRTPVGGKAEAVFKTAAIDHSATSPAPRRAGGPTDVWTVDE
jgi:hypothetical protein